MWIWILVGIAVLIILFYRPRENMTNEVLIDTLKTFGEKGTPPASSKTVRGPGKQQIYGPSASPPPLPTNNGGSASGQSVGGPYPQIFGPDVKTIPGTSGGTSGGTSAVTPAGTLAGTNFPTFNPVGPGQVASDQAPPQDQAYQFNPDLARAFPIEGPPQPFLTDFSNIQH
jgi:hypothetical protein